MDNRNRKSFWLYVVLVYGISWALWVPVAWVAAQHGYVLPNPQTIPELLANGIQDNTHLTLVLLTVISILLPGTVIAAIVAQAYESGKTGLRGLWQRSTHWQVGWRWYGIILGLVVISYLPILIYGLVRGSLPTASQISTVLIMLVPTFLYTFLSSGMEEPGWRGFLLPSLQSRFSARKASIIVAIVWGIWHWPIFLPIFSDALNSPGGVPQAIITLLIQLALFTGGSMLSGALIYTWLYNRTGSTFLCILYHVLFNNASTYMLMLFPNTGQMIPMLGMIIQWVIAIILMRFFWVEARDSGAGEQTSGFLKGE